MRKNSQQRLLHYAELGARLGIVALGVVAIVALLECVLLSTLAWILRAGFIQESFSQGYQLSLDVALASVIAVTGGAFSLLRYRTNLNRLIHRSVRLIESRDYRGAEEVYKSYTSSSLSFLFPSQRMEFYGWLAVTGIQANQYMEEERLNDAVDLLKQPPVELEEITNTLTTLQIYRLLHESNPYIPERRDCIRHLQNLFLPLLQKMSLIDKLMLEHGLSGLQQNESMSCQEMAKLVFEEGLTANGKSFPPLASSIDKLRLILLVKRWIGSRQDRNW